MMPIIALILLLSSRLSVLSQTTLTDQQLYGYMAPYEVPVDAADMIRIYKTCFTGFGLITCLPQLSDDPFRLFENLAYYNNLEDGREYCLQCCGRPHDHVDTWTLLCDVLASNRGQLNLYGREARFARNRKEGDTGYVRCPLKRSACSYDADGFPEGGCRIDMEPQLNVTAGIYPMFLHGYTLTIKVKQYDQYFQHWRGVESCEIVALEKNYSLLDGYFEENFIISHVPEPYPSFDYAKLAWGFVLIFCFVYIILYYCRRNHCVYCAKKLVLSQKLCFRCRIVGVEMPDPVLLQALEEKALVLQGHLPERFPGSRRCMKICRRLYKKSILCIYTQICLCGMFRKKIVPVKEDDMIDTHGNPIIPGTQRHLQEEHMLTEEEWEIEEQRRSSGVRFKDEYDGGEILRANTSKTLKPKMETPFERLQRVKKMKQERESRKKNTLLTAALAFIMGGEKKKKPKPPPPTDPVVIKRMAWKEMTGHNLDSDTVERLVKNTTESHILSLQPERPEEEKEVQPDFDPNNIPWSAYAEDYVPKKKKRKKTKAPNPNTIYVPPSTIYAALNLPEELRPQPTVKGPRKPREVLLREKRIAEGIEPRFETDFDSDSDSD